jgi:hypothetical protein
VTALWSPSDGPLLSSHMPPKILRLPRTPEERCIANFVRRLKRNGRCLEWIGQLDSDGYGKFRGRGAHVFAYELWVGPVSAGLRVLHDCDNPPCVLPKHLKAGTQAQNMAEKAARGRARGGLRPGQQVGEANNAAKVSTKQAQMALDLRECGYWQAEIARLTGIALGNVAQIVRRRTWTHLAPRRGRYMPPRQLPRRWSRYEPGTRLP